MAKGKIRKKDEGANGTWMAEKSNSMRHLHPLLSAYVSYRRVEESIRFIFCDHFLHSRHRTVYKALISQGEFWCWLLLGLISPVCDSLFHGLWTSAGASHGKVFSLSTSLALRRMLQCPHCSKSLSVGLSLVAHLSIEFHWWSFVYLAIVALSSSVNS